MQLENKAIVELLTTIVEQNQKLIESNDQKNQIILELVQENNDLLNRESDEDHKCAGNLDD